MKECFRCGGPKDAGKGRKVCTPCHIARLKSLPGTTSYGAEKWADGADEDPPSLVYLAGLFDGEGCITITRPVRAGEPSGLAHTQDGLRVMQCTLIVVVEMTNEQAVRWFAERWGGSFLLKQRTAGVLAHHQARWVWKVAAKKALPVLHDLKPYLRIKAAQCVLGLEFQEIKSARRSRRGLTEQEIEVYAEMKFRMSALNHGMAI